MLPARGVRIAPCILLAVLLWVAPMNLGKTQGVGSKVDVSPFGLDSQWYPATVTNVQPNGDYEVKLDPREGYGEETYFVQKRWVRATANPAPVNNQPMPPPQPAPIQPAPFPAGQPVNPAWQNPLPALPHVQPLPRSNPGQPTIPVHIGDIVDASPFAIGNQWFRGVVVGFQNGIPIVRLERPGFGGAQDFTVPVQWLKLVSSAMPQLPVQAPPNLQPNNPIPPPGQILPPFTQIPNPPPEQVKPPATPKPPAQQPPTAQPVKPPAKPPLADPKPPAGPKAGDWVMASPKGDGKYVRCQIKGLVFGTAYSVSCNECEGQAAKTYTVNPVNIKPDDPAWTPPVCKPEDNPAEPQKPAACAPNKLAEVNNSASVPPTDTLFKYLIYKDVCGGDANCGVSFTSFRILQEFTNKLENPGGLLISKTLDGVRMTPIKPASYSVCKDGVKGDQSKDYVCYQDPVIGKK